MYKSSYSFSNYSKLFLVRHKYKKSAYLHPIKEIQFFSFYCYISFMCYLFIVIYLVSVKLCFVLGPVAGSEIAATFNISHVEPSAPLLSQRTSRQTICKENVQNDCTESCTCSDVINAQLNNIVELVIYDEGI